MSKTVLYEVRFEVEDTVQHDCVLCEVHAEVEERLSKTVLYEVRAEVEERVE